jgi:glycosyltransferase involved in cell wall biosynthesis
MESNLQRLSVVIPVYNEQDSLRSVVEKVARLPGLFEIVIIDDCSKDGTPRVIASLVEEYGDLLRVHRHEKNSGKTAALRTGFDLTRGDIVIVQDADLEYDPVEIPEVVGPIANDQADVVYGSRFLVRRAARVVYFYHYMANRLLTFCSNVFTNMNMTDVETGYKAFRGDIIRNMHIHSKGFGFEIEVTAKIAKLRCRVYEVPISYYGRTYEEGKKIGPIDGIYALWYIVKYNVGVSLQRSFKRVPQLSESHSVPVATAALKASK